MFAKYIKPKTKQNPPQIPGFSGLKQIQQQSVSYLVKPWIPKAPLTVQSPVFDVLQGQEVVLWKAQSNFFEETNNPDLP